jgi:phosphoribosyl 1,2-cyclic phosphodiesterase
MAMRFCILGSGSSGNSALLVTAGARVLVDAGFSVRKLEQLLAAVGESLARIDAVFLTHEHGDHAAGIEGLRRFPHIRIYANGATARAVQASLPHRPAWQIFETGASFVFRDLEVRSFSVPHDAHDPVGFRFTSGREGDLFDPRRSLAWLTDLGHAPAHLVEQLRECDVLVVEANHCPQLLQADHRRPWATKKRISGRHGHLSNEGVRELLDAAASPRWRRIFLIHLSRDCNSPAAVAAALSGLRARLPCELSIVGAGEGAPFYDLGP